MNKLFALALATVSGAACAQTPAINPMPDGSRDMYAGLGVQAAPRYDGSERHKTSAVPVLQVQWSNGIFISGASVGMHLTSEPSFEVGPLLQYQPARSENGSSKGPTGIDDTLGFGSSSLLPPSPSRVAEAGNRLAGMDKISARVLGGAFFNYYLAPQWRLTSSLLWGAGNERHGGSVDLGVQRLATDIGPQHSLSFSAGVRIVNRDYNQAFFGVTVPEAVRSGNRAYTPAGGLQQARVGVRWNWSLSPSWMLTTNLQATRLLGAAKDSPLVERPTNVTASTAIAYRF